MHFTLPTLLVLLQPLLFSISALPSDSSSNSLSAPDSIIKRSFPLDPRSPKKGGGSRSSSSGSSSSNRNSNNKNQDECNQSDIASASSSLSSQVASLTSSVLSNIPFATATLPGNPFPTLQQQVVATLPPVASAAYAAYTNQLSSFTSRSTSCAGQTAALGGTASPSSSSVATQTSGAATSASQTTAQTAAAAATNTGAAACLSAGSHAGLGLVGGAVVAVLVGM